jgi:gamma-glutamyl:cysteine ligase YbdK (ATP-grasp superfamily)
MEQDDEIRALEQRIEKARAARAQAEAEAERAAKVAALERQARLAEQALVDEPHIAAARQTYGVDGIAVVDSDLGAFVVRAPNHLKWNALAAKADKVGHADLVSMVRSCLVYPDWPRADKMLEEAPAALGVIVDAIVQLAQHRATIRAGK